MLKANLIMVLVNKTALTKEYLNNRITGSPIVICCNTGRVEKKISDAGYVRTKLNVYLSKKLLEFDTIDRPMKAEETAREILRKKESIYVIDFEMLFDPRYKVDPLKLFCELAMYNNVAVQWPGEYNDGKLIYAKPEDPDYHEFDCNAYQIRIVQ